jgi:hypothetical protein
LQETAFSLNQAFTLGANRQIQRQVRQMSIEAESQRLAK